MTRLALLLALPLVACGDDAVSTGSATTTGTDTSSTGATTGTVPTTGEPTTGAAASSSGSASASDGSSSTTASTSTTDDTTEGVDASSSSTTGDTTSSSTTGDTSSSSTTGDDSSSSSSSSSTGDESTGEVVAPPMPAGLCNDNQGPLTSFVDPMPQPEELHIVGVYQATNNAITVTVDRVDIPLTLVLSSYEPVTFTLVLAPGVLLEHVILNGYNPHSVQGQGAAMVTDLSGNFDYFAACAYVWPDDDQGCDTPGIVAGAEALTGLGLTTFVGCYEGISFTID